MNELEELIANGFEGFVPVWKIRCDISAVPQINGVYVLFRTGKTSLRFLETGNGGYFRGRNPNVCVDILQSNIVPESNIMYIGKAKKTTCSDLRKRVWAMLRFGTGHKSSHRGGRYVWQLEDAEQLLIAWKEIDGDAEAYEKSILIAYKAKHGKYPFANLRL